MLKKKIADTCERYRREVEESRVLLEEAIADFGQPRGRPTTKSAERKVRPGSVVTRRIKFPHH